MSVSEYTMHVGDVARALNVTTERVRQLDDELQPVRIGRFRRYNPAIVESVMERRAAPRAPRRHPEVDEETTELSAEARAQINAAIASFLEAQRAEREAAERSAQAFRKFVDIAAASMKIDNETRALAEDYARACARLGEIDRQRRRERVILVHDPDRDEAHRRIGQLERRVDERVTALVAKARAMRRSRPTRPPVPDSRARRARRPGRAPRRRVRRDRATADPDPEPELRWRPRHAQAVRP
ncbi:MAG: hypothetical protein JO257_33555 [Deltaproteobacteria bacterium]|nr:hypothetical protein [Deltaproteobacteria bacterium]